MSFTLRGALSSAGSFLLRANPITGPYFLAKDISESKAFADTCQMAKDGLKVAKDTTVQAAKALNDGANKVLDYPIDVEKGLKIAGDGLAAGYDATVEAGAIVVDETIVKPAVAVKDAYVAADQAITDAEVATVKAIDEGQRSARRGIADWIRPSN